MFLAVPADHDRARRALFALRVVIATLLAIHGWYRLLAGGVEPFGGWLDSLGFPFGFAIAASITAYEIIGTPLLALGRFVAPLCAGYLFIYTMGIALVHWPAGWFVVGGGRNGMEYSVLLLACLGLLAWTHLPKR